MAIISDLGVNQDLMNPMFAGSGLLRSFAQITADEIGSPRAEWLQSYFPGEPTVTPAAALLDRVSELLESGERPGIPMLQSPFGLAYRSARITVEAEKAARRKADAERKARRKLPATKKGAAPSLSRRIVRRLRRELAARRKRNAQ